MRGSIELQAARETLLLLPQRAVFWPRRRMLIVADTHFGKSAVFGAQGVAVPAGADEADRERLERLIADTDAQHLVVLGDFLHAPLAADSADARQLTRWHARLSPTQLHVVAGNHDRGALRRWAPPFAWYEGAWLQPPFRFTHEAHAQAHAHAHAQAADLDEFTLSGHIHPVMRLRGLRKVRPRVPVFWQRRGGLVLPSFGLFTGGYAVRPADEDCLFAVTPERVVRCGGRLET